MDDAEAVLDWRMLPSALPSWMPWEEWRAWPGLQGEMAGMARPTVLAHHCFAGWSVADAVLGPRVFRLPGEGGSVPCGPG